MTPRTATAVRTTSYEQRRSPQPPPLRVARPPATAIPKATRRPLAFVRPVAISASLVVAALLAVVIGNMELTSGQLQLEQVQARLSTVESNFAGKLYVFTKLESPPSIAADAVANGLVPASGGTLTIPSVSLARRLPPPTFSSAPCCALTPGR